MGKTKRSNKSGGAASLSVIDSASPAHASSSHATTPVKIKTQQKGRSTTGGESTTGSAPPRAASPDCVPMLVGVTAGGKPLTSVRQLHHLLQPGATALLRSSTALLEQRHQDPTSASSSGSASSTAKRVSMAEAVRAAKPPDTPSSTPSSKLSSTTTSVKAANAPAGGAWTSPSLFSSTSVSVPMLQAAALRMDALLVAEAKASAAAHRAEKKANHGVQSVEGLSRQSAQRVTDLVALSKLIMWYCLETARGAGALHRTGVGVGGSSATHSLLNGSAGGSTAASASAPASHPSAHTTPAPTSAGVATPEASTASNTDGAASSGLTSWMGSRMSDKATAAPSVVPMMETAISDEHLAPQLLRPSVEFLAQLSCFDGDMSAASVSAEEVRACAVWLLACVLTRFPGASLNACLPRLFPEEDVRRGPQVRHPLLHPLIWGSTDTIRAGAQTGLALLLRAMHSLLQYAQEPRRDRQSFVSMATQSGAVLLALHEALEWALSTHAPTTTVGEQAKRGAARATTVVPASVPQLLSAFAVTITETPYQRCGQCQRCVLRALELPILHACLSASADELNSDMAVPDASSWFHAGTAWLTQILANDSLESAACGLLFPALTAPTSSGGAAADDSVDVLTLLLTSAPERVQVWSCVVQLARLHPSLLHQHFTLAITASQKLVATLASDVSAACGVHIQTSITTAQTPGEPSAASAASVARRVATTSDALAECLRAWLHFMGYVWKSFDNNAQDPGFDFDRQKDRASITEKAAVHHTLLVPVMSVAEAMLRASRTVTTDAAVVSALSSPAKGARGSLCQEGSSAAGAVPDPRLVRDMPRATEELLVALLRCLAQMGDDYATTMSTEEKTATVTFTAGAADGTLGMRDDDGNAAAGEPWSAVQAEAMTTVGMWAWQYPSLVREFGQLFVSLAAVELAINTDPTVRAKAAFALSNMCARLAAAYPPTSPTATSAPSVAAREQYAEPMVMPTADATMTSAASASGGVRESRDVIQQLCNTAVQAVLFDPVTAVQGHGIRMMNYLFQTLTTQEMVTLELEEPEGQCVADGFLSVLLDVLHPMNKHEAKLRWNAACALGMGIAREHLTEAQPVLCAEAIDALCAAVVQDRIFKVRTQAANALAMISTASLPKLAPHVKTAAVVPMEASENGTVDLTARVVRSLCAALEAASATANFRQYREQGSLVDAVRAALRQLLASVHHSRALEKVVEAYKTLLKESELL